jgi:hypothetical protein
MTKPKRAFAEMLIAARGGDGDIDDICQNMSMMDIIYELKRVEKEEPEPEPEPPTKQPEPEPEPHVPTKEPEPEPEPPKKEPEPPKNETLLSIWNRLVNDDDE